MTYALCVEAYFSAQMLESPLVNYVK